jgi:GPN-loop GTPase
VNVISKADLVDKEELDRVLDMDSAAMVSRMGHLAAHGRLQPLTRTIASVVDDYTLVGFLPLDPNDEDSIDTVLTQVDMVRRACLMGMPMPDRLLLPLDG